MRDPFNLPPIPTASDSGFGDPFCSLTLGSELHQLHLPSDLHLLYFAREIFQGHRETSTGYAHSIEKTTSQIVAQSEAIRELNGSFEELSIITDEIAFPTPGSVAVGSLMGVMNHLLARLRLCDKDISRSFTRRDVMESFLVALQTSAAKLFELFDSVLPPISGQVPRSTYLMRFYNEQLLERPDELVGGLKDHVACLIACYPALVQCIDHAVSPRVRQNALYPFYERILVHSVLGGLHVSRLLRRFPFLSAENFFEGHSTEDIDNVYPDYLHQIAVVRSMLQNFYEQRQGDIRTGLDEGSLKDTFLRIIRCFRSASEHALDLECLPRFNLRTEYLTPSVLNLKNFVNKSLPPVSVIALQTDSPEQFSVSYSRFRFGEINSHTRQIFLYRPVFTEEGNPVLSDLLFRTSVTSQFFNGEPVFPSSIIPLRHLGVSDRALETSNRILKDSEMELSLALDWLYQLPDSILDALCASGRSAWIIEVKMPRGSAQYCIGIPRDIIEVEGADEGLLSSFRPVGRSTRDFANILPGLRSLQQSAIGMDTDLYLLSVPEGN